MQSLQIINRPQLPTITSDIAASLLTPVELFYYVNAKEPTLQEYHKYAIKDDKPGYEGVDLAKYHIGQALKIVYQMIGIKPEQEPSPELAKIIASFIIQTYPFITAKEILKAFEFAMQGKFMAVLEHYGVFDLVYISSVLNKYTRYRFDENNRMIKKLGEAVHDRKKELRDALPENSHWAKMAIVNAYEDFKQDHKVISKHLMPQYFDWLVDIGFMEYERNWLMARYKFTRLYNPKFTQTQVIRRVKLMAIYRWFGKHHPNPPFELFDQVSYLSFQSIQELTTLK